MTMIMMMLLLLLFGATIDMLPVWLQPSARQSRELSVEDQTDGHNGSKCQREVPH